MTHKNIFLITVLLLAAALILSIALANGDEETHRSHYMRYQAADELFQNRQFDEPYKVYTELSAIYSDAYVLELKMAVCAMNMGMWQEAIGHSRRTMELYPLLIKDEEFMDSISYSLQQIGEYEAAARIEDYYYNFAALQE